MEKAKIVVSVSEGKFEISGSEEFVNKQIDLFKDIILKSFEKYPIKSQLSKETSKHIETVDQSPISLNDNKSLNSDLSDVYVVDNEQIRIIADLPGDNSKAKTQSAALIYAYAKKQMGEDEASVEEIRTICQNHGCLDSSNFSAHIKSGDPKLYLDKGKGKARSIKLARPGEKRAIEIIQSILENGS
jgi:hypothetical protein